MNVYIAQTKMLTVVGVCDSLERAARRLRNFQGIGLVEDGMGGWNMLNEQGEEVGLITMHEVLTT